MSHYRNGRDREYKVRDHLTDHGWHLVVRASSSKGAADLVMAHPDHGFALVQVGSRTKTLGPDARARLCDLADMGGALALLAVVVPRAPIAYWQVNRSTPRGWQRWEVAA
jgi:hypothetical protein